MTSKGKNIEPYKVATGRYWIVFMCLCFVGLCIFWRLFSIQTIENEIWSERGAEFKHSIRTIDPARGQIQARDGSLLATSVPVYDLRWDTKCEAIKWKLFDAQRDSLCIGLARILGGNPQDYSAKLDKAREGGSRSTRFAKQVPFTDYKALKELPFIRSGRYTSGFVFERTEERRKPFGQLAGRTIGIDREHQRVGIELSWNKELGGEAGKQMQKRISGGAIDTTRCRMGCCRPHGSRNRVHQSDHKSQEI
jgi:cell division protein FtsI (penicillin-binding protein 3)